MTGLIIIGGGGHGAVVAEAAIETNRWTNVSFIDDDSSSERILDFPIVGTMSDLTSHIESNSDVVVAVGDNVRRLELLREVEKRKASIATIVHPFAFVSRYAQLSVGTVVCASAVVGARAKLGIGCIVNTGATVDHDCKLGKAVHISPGANLAGAVTVGDCSWVGIGSSVRDGIVIGCNATVGAGAAVVSDVTDHATVGGVPAKPLGNS